MNLSELKENCLKCKKCELCKTRTNVVFGYGNENAEIMFIGEGPGEQEDLQAMPFVGRSGKLLDDYLNVIGLKRENVYIANIVKCRPPKNRDPMKEEQDLCIDWLREQVKIINPKSIICLGRIAAARIIKPDIAITKEHGMWFQRGDKRYMAIFHPAAVLRDPSKRGETLMDFKKLISD